MITPFNSATMSGMIEAGKNLDMSHNKMHYKSKLVSTDGIPIIINYSSIIDKYYDFLEKIIVEIEFTEEEFPKFKFQPKRFCQEYYDNVELWSSIMRINNITSASQFTKRRIKVFTKDIFDVLNEIMILEKDAMRDNRIEIYGK